MINSTSLRQAIVRTTRGATLCLIMVLFPWLSSAAPTLVSTASLDGQSVALRFSGGLDPATAADATRYSVPGATVQAATLLADNQTVLLSVTGLTGTNYTVTATGIRDAQGSDGNVTGTGSVLGFTVTDIGNMNTPSVSYAYTNSVIEATADGGAIWFAADAANYIYQTRTGDFDVRVRISKAAGGSGGSNIALDVRESTDPASRHVAITIYPGIANWTAFYRDTAGGASGVLSGNWRVPWPGGAAIPNIWLRVKHSSGTFRTYGSTNGLDWLQIGDPYTPTSPYTATLVGLATAATDAGVPPVEAEFSDFGEFALGNASIVIHSQPQSVTTTENHPASFNISAELVGAPAGLLNYQWQSNGVDIAGAINSNYSVFPKLANSGDQYRVVLSAPGLSSVTSSVAILTVEKDATAPYVLSSAGLAGHTVAVGFNESLDPTTATDTSHYNLGAGVPVEGATLLADQQTVVLNTPALSGSNYVLQIQGVTDLAGNPATGTFNGEVLDLTVTDLGNLNSPSIVYADSPDHIVTTVDGGAIWFTADADNYMYQTRTGDFDVRVQVASAVGGGPDANVALDVRESTDPSSRHIAITVYPSQNNWTSFKREETGGDSAVLSGNWRIPWPTGIGYPNVWLRMRYASGTFSAFGSTNGVDWVQVGDNYTPTVPYGATLIGLAATTTTAASPVRAEFRNFSDFSITGASIHIQAQPQNVTATQNHPATFTVEATLQNGPAGALAYQWQKNGQDIPGAVQSDYVLTQPNLADQGSQFRVRLSAPGVESVYSAPATLTVLPDTVPPVIETTAGLKEVSVGVRFNELMDPTTAADASHYSLGPDVNILSTRLLPDGRSVILQVQGLTGPTYTLQVTGVSDFAGNTTNLTVTGRVLSYTITDIGNLNAPSANYAFDTNAIAAEIDGGGIWWNADAGNFIYEPMTGDFDVRVQVTKVSGGDLNSNMLLDVRESAEPGSRHVGITVYPSQNNWTAFFRDVTDGPSGVLAGNWRVPWPTGVAFPNVWIRIKKSGNTYSTYGGTNGIDWTPIGDPYTPSAPYTQNLVGMASAVTDAGQPPLFVEYANFSPVVVVVVPELQVTRDGSNVTLSWPLDAAGFQLQQSAQVGEGAAWNAVTAQPVAVGGNYTVSLPIGSGNQFYRLSR